MISHIAKYEKRLYTPVSSMGGSRIFYGRGSLRMMFKMLALFPLKSRPTGGMALCPLPLEPPLVSRNGYDYGYGSLSKTSLGSNKLGYSLNHDYHVF